MAMTDENILDRFFGSMQPCDTAALRDCLTGDAIVWHSFDRKPMQPDDLVKTWEGMASAYTERGVADVCRQQTPTGYVQQHLFVVRGKDGVRKAWPVCVVVQVRDGKIARLDEYIDLSAAFDPGEGEAKTPGF